MPALLFFFLLTISGDVCAENRVYITGVTVALFVFHSKTLEVDAAFRLLRRRQRTEKCEPESSDDVPAEVARAITSLIETLAETGATRKHHISTIKRHFQQMGTPGQSALEKSVTKVLRWRRAAPQLPGFLHEIFPPEEPRSFVCSTGPCKLVGQRVPRFDGTNETCQVHFPTLGEVTQRPVTLPRSDALDPVKATRFFDKLKSSLLLSDALGPESLMRIQSHYRLYVTLDVLRTQCVTWTHEVPAPDVVGYDLFRLGIPIECDLEQLLQHMAEQRQSLRRAETVRSAQLSLTLQVCEILAKLMEVGAFPPEVDAKSFVVSSTGVVFLDEYYPLLSVSPTYAVRQYGTLAAVSQLIKKNVNFVPIRQVGAVPNPLDLQRPARDAARIQHRIWCLSRAEGDADSKPTTSHLGDLGRPETPADGAEATTSSASSVGASSSSGEDATRATLDWTECDGVPHVVRRIAEGLMAGCELMVIRSGDDYADPLRLIGSCTS